MPLSGDITTFSLAAVGRLIHSEKKTGVLQVTTGVHYANIYFKYGDIVFVESDLAEDVSLGSLLRANKLVSREKIDEALSVAKETGKRLGVILIDQGHISQKKLVSILHYQFKEVIAKVLAWESGEFTYSDGLSNYIEDIRLEMDPIRLVAEAQKWKEYRNLIPSDRQVFRIKDGTTKPELLGGDGVSRVMLLINGKRSVAEIIAETNLSRLAVYKALASLASQGLIVSEGMKARKQKSPPINAKTRIGFFLNLIDVVMDDLSRELGAKKASALIETSIRRNPYYDFLFRNFNPGAGLDENFRFIERHLENQEKEISENHIDEGFHHLFFHLLQEEYQILGFKAAQNTIQRMSANLGLTPVDQKPLVQDAVRLLSRYTEDEAYLGGRKEPPLSDKPFGIQIPDKTQAAPSSLEGVGGAAIIAFYSKAIQLLMNDLNEEIGKKALNILGNIIKSSEDYETFLSQFNIHNSISENVEHISRYIQMQEHSIGKQRLNNAFQQVLMNLIQEEKRLLGSKTTLYTISKLEAYFSEPKQGKYKTLANQLIPVLKSISGSG
jgi:hypothetical protein